MIHNSRIVLSRLIESDVSDEYLATLNDAEYMKYSRNSAFNHDLSSQVQYISEFKQSNNLLFGIKNVEDQKLLGTINCYIDFSRMTLNLGFLIFKNQQGKGYASMALEILIPYLEQQFPGMCAVIGSNRDNLAMHHVAKKLHFQIESQDSQDGNVNLKFFRKFSKVSSANQPFVPDFVFNAERIGVAAYDAGGAEQISWLLQNIPQKVLAYVDGPAKSIFENSKTVYDGVEKLNEIMECDLLITGSGWMSQLEVAVIKEAKFRGIPCITILDHWVNYRERFGDAEENQPQILAVTNSIALEIAQEKFADKVVWLIPDFQIEAYREALRVGRKSTFCVLILLEPFSIFDSLFTVNKEVLENLLRYAFAIKQSRGLSTVLIRPHPSQVDIQSILEMLGEFSGEFEVSTGGSLIEDLKNSEAVLGFSSYALYVASQCDIATYSFFAGRTGHWTSHFPKILELDL
jgi:RimJ/RimL family protein N-acetyltransferase